MAGYVHMEKPGSDARPVAENIRVPLRVRRADAISAAEQAALSASPTKLATDEATPILLPAGETLRLVGTSEDLLADLPSGSALSAAYKGGERRLHLLLGRFGRTSWRKRKNASALSRFKSRPVLFRDLRFGNLL